jgi:hypothetical protein
MTDGKLIKGQVAKVFESPVGVWKAAINRGEEHEVEVGYQFTVYGEPIEIRDTDKTLLGTIKNVKAVIETVEVADQYSICKFVGEGFCWRGDTVLCFMSFS